jgi:hypothetical protein
MFIEIVGRGRVYQVTHNCSSFQASNRVNYRSIGHLHHDEHESGVGIWKKTSAIRSDRWTQNKCGVAVLLVNRERPGLHGRIPINVTFRDCKLENKPICGQRTKHRRYSRAIIFFTCRHSQKVQWRLKRQWNECAPIWNCYWSIWDFQ